MRFTLDSPIAASNKKNNMITLLITAAGSILIKPVLHIAFILILIVATSTGVAMESGLEIQERIRQAADALYQENERTAFPTVDAVRKRAKVNMNDASIGMRAWRKAQTVGAQDPVVPIPEPIQRAIGSAMQTLWAEALALSAESLRAAQTLWEREREEAAVLTEQVGNAFDAQSAELAILQKTNSGLQQEISNLREALELLQAQHDDGLCALASSQSEVSHALSNANTLEGRCVELRQALDVANDAIATLTRETASERRAHEAIVSDLAKNLVRRLELTRITAAKKSRFVRSRRRKLAALSAGQIPPTLRPVRTTKSNQLFSRATRTSSDRRISHSSPESS